jgi:O-acetyl-ADP-ribose deacetylase (regulator of RNase III)
MHIQQRIKAYEMMSLEEKRSQYNCSAGQIRSLAKDVIPWSRYAKSSRVPKSAAAMAIADEELNAKIGIFLGDITTLELDAIVNAANERCLGGGGVDGAIHKAAGSELMDECRLLGGCPTGEAKATFGYKLPAKHVIHAVGPQKEKADELANAYKASLERMKELGLRHIAFPCISTGIYGYPNDKAALVVAKVLREFLERDPYADKVENIVLCLFGKLDVDAYNEALPIYFPLAG